MKLVFSLLVFLVFCVEAFAQDSLAKVRGKLISLETSEPLQDISLLNRQKNEILFLDSTGNFEIENVPFGETTLIIIHDNQVLDSFSVAVTQADISLGILKISGYSKIQNQVIDYGNIPTVTIENDINVLDDEAISEEQNISIVLQAETKRDPFINAASFVFSQYNFRTRGYNRPTQQVFINGVLMNDLHSGSPIWAQWGGLNEATKNQISTYGLASHQQAFGGVNGAIAIDANASEQNQQTKISYASSNRSYNNRLMLTHSSGISKKGWAYTIAASRRWADEAYISGTAYDAYAASFSLVKIINSAHQLSLQIFGTNNLRARSGSALMEVYELAKDRYYNPNWGWQNGTKRNARIAKSFQPMTILQYQCNPNEKFQISFSTAFQFGQASNSSLDWYNAIDPRPDYYRNLPSYYQNTHPLIAQHITDELSNDPDKLQINWDRLYAANKTNRETLYNIGGLANDSLIGNRSLYAVGADVEQMTKAIAAINIFYKCNDVVTLTGGFQSVFQKSNLYRRMEDLLGGDYFLNYNMFAAQQFLGNQQYLQYDVNKPNIAVQVGDKYRYNYSNTLSKTWGWAQVDANFKRFTVFAAGNIGLNNYLRNGAYKNGLFVNNSFGKSANLSFMNYAFKGGVTYKINGRNYLLLNSFMSSEDPGINNLFIAPRNRNQVIENIQMVNTKSVEFGYLLRASKWNVRAMGYATDINHATTIQRFFNDDPQYQSFVNFVMADISSRYTGTELAFLYNIHPLFTVNAAASVGQAFYTNRPKVSIYNDNDTNTSPTTKEVFMKNYYLGIGPQSAYTVGCSYNAKRYWYLKINANFFERNYVGINPDRRSVEAAEFMTETDPSFQKIFGQEKLPSFYTIDISGGKSWRLTKILPNVPSGTSLYFNFGISNLLNNTNIIATGFEQLRYDFTNNNPDKFPNKYVYGLGRTFFANLTLKF